MPRMGSVQRFAEVRVGNFGVSHLLHLSLVNGAGNRHANRQVFLADSAEQIHAVSIGSSKRWMNRQWSDSTATLISVTGDSSFSFIEDSEQGSSFYDTFIENEVLVNFGDDNTEILNEITEISGVVIGNEAAADARIADARAAEVVAGNEVANSKPVSDIWKFFV